MDACNHVMARTGRDPWLISWDSTANLQAQTEGKPPMPFRFKRTRTVVYTGALVALYVPLPGGGVRNAYTLHIANKVADAGNIRLTVHGIPGAVLSTEAQRANASDALLLPVPADDNGEFRVFVTIPPQAAVAAGSISLAAERLSDGAKAETSAVFMTGHKP
jgi:polyferredoxin